MAYQGINKARFKFLLRFGTGDDELRRFFSENRSLLILKGAKVQNLPRGWGARITSILNLPDGTDPVVQKWFSTNLTMIDPESVDELVGTFRLHEEEDEEIPESDAKRLSRSCLIHLFSAVPASKLVEFLKSPLGDHEQAPDHKAELDKEIVPQPSHTATELAFLDSGLASALVALLEGKDPDEYLSGLPPAIASLVTGLYAIKEGYAEEATSTLEELDDFEQAKTALSNYALRLQKIKESSKSAILGIHLVHFDEAESPDFDFDRDQIIGKCTNDSSEKAVFIQPFAIQTWNGRLLSLEKRATREALFPNSGDVQAFIGQHYPRQPKRGEIGIWHIAPNEHHNPVPHHNNFHLKSAKSGVYEVHQVPFVSTDYDSVRGYIKEQMARSGRKQSEPILFLLRDNLIVGCPSGKDLTRDDGFNEGLLCWRDLSAFRFEGRLLVPGPLPAYEQYECATLTSTLKKFISNKKADTEKLTKSQQRCLLDWVNSGEGHLNATRQARLLEELKYLENDDSGIASLLEEAMKYEKIVVRIEQSIQEKVDEQTGIKSELIKEIENLGKERNSLRKSIAKQEREKKALPSSVSKAIKESIKKANENAPGTLGQVVVFKALMEGMGSFNNPMHALGDDLSSNKFRTKDHDSKLFMDTLTSLGLSCKHARAVEMTGEAVFNAGMILVIEGIAARLAAEAWGCKNKSGCILMDCTIGLTDDGQMKSIAVGETRSVVILDANLSPLNVYARFLIDHVQRRILSPDSTKPPKILMSLSDGVASLPLPSNIEAMVVRVSLDHKLDFIREDDVAAELEDMHDEDTGDTWGTRLWKPALSSLLQQLNDLPTNDSALVLSVLKAGLS